MHLILIELCPFLWKFDITNKGACILELDLVGSWIFMCTCTFSMKNKKTRLFSFFIDSSLMKLFPFSTRMLGPMVKCSGLSGRLRMIKLSGQVYSHSNIRFNTPERICAWLIDCLYIFYPTTEWVRGKERSASRTSIHIYESVWGLLLLYPFLLMWSHLNDDLDKTKFSITPIAYVILVTVSVVKQIEKSCHLQLVLEHLTTK